MDGSNIDDIIIPAKVRYDKRLPANARLLYGDLRAKAKDGQYYMSSRHWLAEMTGMSRDSVKGWLNQLDEYGYIKRERIYDTDGKRKPGWMIHIVPIEEVPIPTKGGEHSK
jgi:hypothetical protein